MTDEAKDTGWCAAVKKAAEELAEFVRPEEGDYTLVLERDDGRKRSVVANFRYKRKT